MRKDYFLAGLGMRILMMVLFIIVNHYDKYNDMSEIIYYAMKNMLNGQNPYSVIYEIEWGSGSFMQPFNYGPVTLILLLPAMLFPFWYNSFWLGMFIMINFYAYVVSNFLMKKLAFDEGLQKLSTNARKTYNSRTNKDVNTNLDEIDRIEPRKNRFIYYMGAFFWIVPYGTLVVTNFLILPIFLCTLAFYKRDNPFWCSFYIILASFCYQLTMLFVPVFVIYHYKKSFKNIILFGLGAIPGCILLLIFMLWGPGGAFYSLFLYTSDMGYIKCPTCAHNFDSWSVVSIPKLFYTYSDGTIQIGNQCRIALIIILGLYLLRYLFTDRYDDLPELYIQKYMMAATVGFILTNNYGQAHYFLFLIIPVFIYLQITHPNWRKEVPIGLGLYSWDEFEQYLLKFHQLPD